ncbi:hypothetical protein B0H13DRAFT_1446941, partial [Mycena leptocephala]
QLDTRQNPDRGKQRDKGKMAMFPCGGWVTIWAAPDEPDCFVCIRHLDCHQKYVCIDLPEDVKKFMVSDSWFFCPFSITYPRPNFLPTTVYNHWLKQHQANWRRCDDELESAKILLKQ